MYGYTLKRNKNSSLVSMENNELLFKVFDRDSDRPNIQETLKLVGFGFNGPLRQYFSLYRAVSRREGERGRKG